MKPFLKKMKKNKVTIILEGLKFVEHRHYMYKPEAFKVTQNCNSCKTFLNVSFMIHSFTWFFHVNI